jgi:opacity protein-like surface antigen
MIQKKSLLLLISILIFVNNSLIYSQSDQDSTKNSLKKGSWSLQFQISQNFTLRNFQGSNLSAKKHLSSKSAIRFGIGLSGTMTDREKDLKRDDTNYLSDETIEDKSTQISLNSYYIYYPHPGKKINLYYGGGPVIAYSKLKSEFDSKEIFQDTLSRDIHDENDRKSWSIGILALIGVEWFLNQQISIHAEYGSSLSYIRTETEGTRVTITSENEEDYRSTNTVQKRFSFRSDSVKFGISVYF